MDEFEAKGGDETPRKIMCDKFSSGNGVWYMEQHDPGSKYQEGTQLSSKCAHISGGG